MLPPSARGLPDELLKGNTRNQFASDEQGELDRFLMTVDQLVILKRWAKYKLRELARTTGETMS